MFTHFSPLENSEGNFALGSSSSTFEVLRLEENHTVPQVQFKPREFADQKTDYCSDADARSDDAAGGDGSSSSSSRKELPGLAVDIHTILWFSMYNAVQNGTISLGYLKMVHGSNKYTQL